MLRWWALIKILTVSEESFYHRRKSPSQTAEVAKMQIASQEMWGGPKRNTVSSDPPVVKAYMGKIPRDTEKGVEFTTTVKTDSYHPVWAFWSEREGKREGVWVEDGYAKIKVSTTFCNQLDDQEIL
jgi:hypothetical protein